MRLKKLVCWIFGHKKLEKTQPFSQVESDIRRLQIITSSEIDTGIIYGLNTKYLTWKWWECSRCGASTKPWGI